MNITYYIRRSNILRVLGLPGTIPVGRTGEWADVEVPTGWYHDNWPNQTVLPDGTVIRPNGVKRMTVVLPRVRLVPSGVANRIQVLCPVCKKTWVRFSVLQQHAGTKACKEAK